MDSSGLCWRAALGAITAMLAAACGGAPRAVPRLANGTPAATTRSPAAPPVIRNTPTASNIAIAPDIRRACGISDADAYFAFDSARITTGDRSPLDQVASCFARGPLAGRAMSLVGHADPRGPTDYNMTLGLSRADAVAGYIAARGVSRARTASTSRGAMDATGTDEAGWARDRRVDVLLRD